MRNFRMLLAYDGTRYRGWQRLPGAENTIQGKLEQTLSKVLEEPITVFGSGRTDAGVHAKGQVANFHCESAMPCAEILSQLRRYLPEDIGIYSCKEAAPRFHARLNAKQKTYCYRVWNSLAPCVFQRRFVHILPERLDTAAMEQAGGYFLGTHDFAAFCTNRSKKKSTLRTIYALEIVRDGEEVRISVTADGFLYNMVRILAGTLLEVGLGKRSPDTIPQLFSARRAEAGALAPAKGLCLMEVEY